ncbi:uncharacterized protein LOC109723007 [Ananas comosus]|uniref:Uncharacterized protein LOC109723007 n=1 Tax=Ananas comosus TaxID=4615 RepID=A0A6P5GG26_ANACO|nr:uncharacterized protein LOC109723007 [Ananas comosus]
MIENNPESVKRYAPPVHRNRSLNRRKSGDRFEKTNNSYGSDGEKNQPSYSKNLTTVNHGDPGVSSIRNESTHSGLIPMEGCCTSEAAQLLTERWAAAMHSCNDPSTDSSEKPVIYSGASGSSWGHLKLPHQMDFLGELQRALSAQAGAVPTAGYPN